MVDPVDMQKIGELLVNYQRFYMENQEQFAALSRVQRETLDYMDSMSKAFPAMKDTTSIMPMFGEPWFQGLVDTHRQMESFTQWVRTYETFQDSMMAFMPPSK